MDDGVATATTTSAGMPPVSTVHDALDQGSENVRDGAHKLRASAAGRVRSFADEGKAQVTSTLTGLFTLAHEIADRLQNNGGAPVADYVRKAADVVEGWSHSVENKSVDEITGDVQAMVRKSPALAIGIAVASGFVLSRFLKATSHGSISQTR